jgi:hypothetical protein
MVLTYLGSRGTTFHAAEWMYRFLI